MAESQPEVGGRVGKMCQLCLVKDIQRTANVYCPSCNEFQCNDCTSGHTIYATMKDHKLLSVSEGLSYLSKKLDMKGLDICKKHNLPFEFYCKDERVLFCSKCAIVGHKRCLNVTEIEHIADDGQCHLLVDQLHQAITSTNQVVENITQAEACLTSDIQTIPEKLSEMRENIIQMFDEFAEKVTTDANTYRDQTTADWAKRKLECETKVKNMNSYLETIENVSTKGTPSQQFIAAHSMRETIQNDAKNADTLSTDLGTSDISCNFDKHFETLKSNLLSAMKPSELELIYSVSKETKLVQIASIDLKQVRDDVGEPMYSGLDFLPDGRLVVVDNKNGKCLLYDENLKVKNTYKLPYQHPKCVAVVSDGEVVITTGGEYRLDFLHVSKSNEITLHRTCKVSVLYGSISMKDEETFVVSTIDNTPPVRIVSMSGKETYFDIAFPSKKYPIDTSSCTYIRGQDKLVLTDMDDNTVFIYDIRTGEKVTIRGNQIQKPHGAAVGPYGHVFVGSKSTSSLVEITAAGRVLSSHQVDMEYPSYIAVSRDRRRLAVSNSAIAVSRDRRRLAVSNSAIAVSRDRRRLAVSNATSVSRQLKLYKLVSE